MTLQILRARKKTLLEAGLMSSASIKMPGWRTSVYIDSYTSLTISTC